MFVKIYLDENVSFVVAGILRSRGFDATTAQEAGNKGLSDDEQLKFALTNSMTILTHDRVDFEELAKRYFAGNKTHGGIIIVYPHPPQEIARRLTIVLNNITADEMKNQIIYI
jgi:predicted nuclease of predicted toxin-antitoxin system